jgi:lipopolysaccharide/colanic/teichoic acid biosynthesis glycosyltransferase
MSMPLSLMRLLRGFVGERRSHRALAACGLHSVKQFRDILARERARADRCDDQFALLHLGVEDARRDLSTLLQAARILRRRLRISDEAGWLDSRTIGVLLPGTPGSGAWTAAEGVCLSFPAGIPLPNCAVSRYPFDWLPDNRDTVPQAEWGPAPVPRKLPLVVADGVLSQGMPWWKRGLDIMGASIGLLLLWPLFLLVAAAIKLTSPGPVFFVQRRSGRAGKVFDMYKFRSMVPDAEARKQSLASLNEQDGPAFKIKGDPRVTPLGRVLRAASVDELPQLWNVLLGDMSLVGPRPLPCQEAEAYSDWHRQRLDATPGLTCFWQVQARSRVSFDEWTRMDIRYIRSRSLWQDVKLLLTTVPALVFRRGW